MPYKIGMVSLGCPKNQVDAEIMLSLLRNGGFEITGDERLADAIIVNTCGFIESAKAEAIENILEVSGYKENGNLKALIVTGCMAERYRDEVKKEIPEIDAVVGIGSNKDIVAIVKAALEGKGELCFDEKSELLLSGERVLSTPKYTAYLRIADGCDNKCTYCAIPSIRGGFRSRMMEDVLAEAKGLAENGVKELVLIAQDTTRYGEDIYGRLELPVLLKELCKINGIEWIRLLYIYPDRITDELLNVMAEEEKILKYLDIPLQHASGKILKRMNRSGDRESLTALLNKVRAKMPDMTIRTTFIVGFPDEDENDFRELAEFIKEIKFDRLGCFTYSMEEGTPAALFDNQIEEDVKARRMEVIMLEQSEVMEAINEAKVGTTASVLVEGFDSLNKCYYGRTKADAPDIDGKVFFETKKSFLPGDIILVEITDTLEYDVIGTVID